MAIYRLNHAVLYVRDLARSVAFYREVLGFEPIDGMDGLRGAAFLRAADSTNDHDLGLFEVGAQAGPSRAGRGSVGLYHLAWEVDTLADLQSIAAKLTEAGALVGASDHGTTRSLYGQDPDGLEFEIAWIVPAAQLEDADLTARSGIRPLDLPGDIARFGAQLAGGTGISRPAAATAAPGTR